MLRTWTLAAAAVVIATAVPAAAQRDAARTIDTQAGPVRVEVVARGLANPWGIAPLPDGTLLVTERAGRLRLVQPDGRLSEPLRGVPEVVARGQGGLLDVVLDPAFASNRRIYLTYSEPGEGGAGTAVARARLGDGGLDDVRVIFRQLPKATDARHFGSRLAFGADGHLFVTLGDRMLLDQAQDLSGHIGKVVRIDADGRVPTDNPFAGRPGARPEVWSFGHRNPQGAAVHPRTGALWIHEFGPRGGDEINVPEPGRNYGWPLVSWGDHYSGQPIAKPPTRPELAQDIRHWVPAISPSGMAFYTGDRFRAWRDNLLIGGLGTRGIVRLTLDGTRVTGEERIALGARIRDVRQGRNGEVYALTDEGDGAILRLVPAGG
jgi:aldose sugar dehydrogenase